MPIEAIIWSLLLMLSPALIARLWPGLRERIDSLPFNITPLGPWFHSLGLPYLAIILGSVSDRKMGLVGITPLAWFMGAIACSIALVVAWLVLGRMPSTPDPECTPRDVLLNETRWTFYRGAASLWLPGIASTILALGMILLEQGIRHVTTLGLEVPPENSWKLLMRATLSTSLFITTGNFWLTAGTQLLLTAGLLKRNLAQNA